MGPPWALGDPGISSRPDWSARSWSAIEVSAVPTTQPMTGTMTHILIICHISWDFMVMNWEISYRDYTIHVHLLGSSWDFPGWKFMVILWSNQQEDCQRWHHQMLCVWWHHKWLALCASSVSSMASVRSKKGLEPYIHPEMVVSWNGGTPSHHLNVHRIVH